MVKNDSENFKKLKSTKSELEIELSDEFENILNPITHILLENKDVEYASCLSDHPLASKRRLFIRMKKGSPNDALKTAVKHLKDEMKKLSKSIE
jgi:DNA-directed RNA polymerase subunit L